MKTRSFWLAMLSAMAVTAGFTSCSDDDEWNWSKEGSKIEMSVTRAFVLDEGSMGKNNAGITYFDWKTDKTYGKDLYMAQNGVGLGDLGQDIIVDGNDIYVITSGSRVIYRLNGVGIRQGSMSISNDLGDPRYGIVKDDYLYVTCYGGYVAKIDKKNLSLVGKVEIGKNPEYITEKDNKIYCTCSGWGADKRVAVIDIKSFNKADFFEVMDNPDRIINVAGHIFVQGYGAYYDYPWGELDVNSGKFTEKGHCSSWAGYKNALFLAFSETNWSTYETTTTLSAYDVKAGNTNTSFFKNVPAEIYSSSVYGISVNEKTGDIYVMTSDFTTPGQIYHFNSDGSFVGKFSSTGINSRKIVFLD